MLYKGSTVYEDKIQRRDIVSRQQQRDTSTSSNTQSATPERNAQRISVDTALQASINCLSASTSSSPTQNQQRDTSTNTREVLYSNTRYEDVVLYCEQSPSYGTALQVQYLERFSSYGTALQGGTASYLSPSIDAASTVLVVVIHCAVLQALQVVDVMAPHSGKMKKKVRFIQIVFYLYYSMF